MGYRVRKTEALFKAGHEGYSAFRIPAVIALPGGRVIALAEGRRDSAADYGAIDIVCRISEDGGETFGPLRIAVSGGRDTAGNPCPIFDRETGRIVMVFNRNLADGPEHLILQGKAPRTVHVIESADGGDTWSNERDITSETKLPNWTWYAAGPCHGLQLPSGRLIVPCNHAVLKPDQGCSGGYISHVICSDDHGKSWQIGGEVVEHTNECCAVLLKDGTMLLNMRSFARKGCRALAVSVDEGLSFTDYRLEAQLPEPCCQGAMLTVCADGETHILFTNPACADDRRRMTLHESTDDGKNWQKACVLTEGPAAYSDLAEMNDESIAILYETGTDSPYERIDWALLDRI